VTDAKYALLWDMDGTIVDDAHLHFAAWMHTFDLFGLTLDQELYKGNFGRNNRVLLPLLLGFDPTKEQFNNLVTVKETHFRKLVLQSKRVVPGVENWLSAAQSARLKQALVSSADRVNIECILSGYELDRYFDEIIPGTDFPAKPAPDMFLAAAERFQMHPENCCVIEDSLAGVIGARQAGMKCIGVATSLDYSELHQADLIIEDFRIPFASALAKIGFEIFL
jgi:beta-phosphoglucomutase